jgi:uncharacterized protein YutE (UPF0331/DUF86 family)
MDELAQHIAAEKEQIAATLNALQKTLRRKRRGFVELAAIATCLHNSYSGMENLLKRVFKHLKISLPDSPTSHKDLLSLAVANGIISQGLSNSLDEYRTFRHFFVHGYGILLSEAPMQPLANELPEVWERFERELNAFVAALPLQAP